MLSIRRTFPPGSAIKDFKIKINVGATASVGATTKNGPLAPANLVFDYGESAVLALSFGDSSGAGGKIVLTANAKDKGTINDPTTLGQNYSNLAPSITITLTVYNDSGSPVFSKTWTDPSSLCGRLFRDLIQEESRP